MIIVLCPKKFFLSFYYYTFANTRLDLISLFISNYLLGVKVSEEVSCLLLAMIFRHFDHLH